MKKRQKRKTLRNKLDKVFSELVRSRGACQRCGNTETLQTSHIYTRTFLSTRWLEENAHCLCAGCHFWWHQHPVEGKDFVLKTHGSGGYNRLKKIANTRAHFTDSQLEELYLELKSKL